MAKDKLSVASTTPVDLDETDQKKSTDSKETKDGSEKDESKELDDVASEEAETKESETKESETKEPETKETETTAIQPKEPESETQKSKTEENDDAPPRPERPLSPLSRVKKDLQDAFPNMEEKYVQAVLVASQGQADPAFSALLYLSDPTYVPDITAPVPPPVPPKQELTDDELLARKLQKEFEREDRKRRSRHRRQNQPAPGDESPDEIDQLKESFSQGFEEAKTTINGWVSGLSKKFSQEPQGQNPTQSPKLFGALGGSSFNQNQRGKRFDEDPEILASDFSHKVNVEQDKPPSLPKRETRPEQKDESKWQPLNSDVPVTSDAFLVTDSEDEEPAAATNTTKK